MGELGLFGLPFPEEYGGGGADFVTYCIAIEEIARVDASMAITLEAGVSLGASPFFYMGTEEQKQEYLVPMIAGEVLGAFGLTEAEAGSDAGATKTRGDARRRHPRVGHRRAEDLHHQLGHGDDQVRHDHRAHRTTRDLEHRRRRGHSGIRRAAAVPQDGLARLRHARARLRRLPRARGSTPRDARRRLQDVPADTRRRPHRDRRARARAWRRRASTRRSRTRTSAARSAARSVATSRSRSSAPTWPWPSRTRATSCTRPRGCATRASRSGRAAAIAKLYASEIAVDATRDAVQIHGGYGYIDETPVSRFYRDAKILEIGEGTSEIQRLVIARSLGLPVE